MTYRERRAAKADRLREWADKRDVKGDTARAAADQTAGMIPFGQPILVGHHSERGDRNRRSRMRGNYDKAYEHRSKAADFRRRADGIEAAADNAIYSDDTDAAERLACEPPMISPYPSGAIMSMQRARSGRSGSGCM